MKIAETDNDRSSHNAIVTRNYLKTTKAESLGFIFFYLEIIPVEINQSLKKTPHKLPKWIKNPQLPLQQSKEFQTNDGHVLTKI